MTEAAVTEVKDETKTPPQETDQEVKARRLGWVAKEEFRGDPDKWRPADEFLDRGERLLPLLQRDNDKLHRRIGEVETLLKETREASKELLEFTSKSEQRAYERAKAEIQAKIEHAAANADTNAVRAEVQNLDALNKEHAPVRKTEARTEQRQTQQIDPVIQDWIDKEEWFSRDRVLNTYAGDVFGDLERSKPGVSKAELLAETKRRTVEKFPEKFGINPAREGAAAVAEPSGGNSGRKKGKTYENLPAGDKAQCDRQVRVLGITREEWLKHYDWES